MAAVPSIGRATRVERAPVAAEADATHALYERYSGQIFGYCLHQLGSREEAEDAVQSTFLNAFRGLSRGVVPELESAWLFKIAHNVCLSRRRSSWRRGRIESPEDFQEMQDTLAAPSRAASDDLVGFQDVLAGMPENQRRAILLREWQGLSYREIADEMELSQSAVETLIFRARRSLAQGLEQPPEAKPAWRRGARRGLDLGGLVGIVKALLAGGTAVVAIAGAAGGAAVADHHLLRGPHTAAAPASAERAARMSVDAAAAPAPVAARVAPLASPFASPDRAHAAASTLARPRRARAVEAPIRRKASPAASSAPAVPAAAAAPTPQPQPAQQQPEPQQQQRAAAPPAPAPQQAAPVAQAPAAAPAKQEPKHGRDADAGAPRQEASHGRSDEGHGSSPGQQRKADRESGPKTGAVASAPAAPAAPSPAPPAAVPPVPLQQAPAAPAVDAVAPAAPVSADAVHGNGNGNGHGNGKEKQKDH